MSTIDKYIKEKDWKKVAREIKKLSKGHVVSYVKDDCSLCGKIIKEGGMSMVNKRRMRGIYHEKCFYKKYEQHFGRPYSY